MVNCTVNFDSHRILSYFNLLRLNYFFYVFYIRSHVTGRVTLTQASPFTIDIDSLPQVRTLMEHLVTIFDFKHCIWLSL